MEETVSRTLDARLAMFSATSSLVAVISRMLDELSSALRGQRLHVLGDLAERDGHLLHGAGGLLDGGHLLAEAARELLHVLEGAARVVDDAAEAAELLFAVPRLGLGAVDALVELAGLGLAGLHLEVRLLAVRLGRLDLELQALAHGAGLADLAAQGLELAARAGPFLLQLVPLGLGVVEGLGGSVVERSPGRRGSFPSATERMREAGSEAPFDSLSPTNAMTSAIPAPNSPAIRPMTYRSAVESRKPRRRPNPAATRNAM
jgi:hypothetical protein